MSDEKFILFYGGYFSQWFKCDFEIDGIKYNCAEQWMMAEKARLFGDDDALNIIMEARKPAVQKATGKAVKGFDREKWEAVARDIVFKGNMAKFSQNPDLKLVLMKTQGSTLVEASPTDRIWGIGVGISDPKAQNRGTWRGTNWLGEVLMRVREELAKNKG
jgi:hypothetical protein